MSSYVVLGREFENTVKDLLRGRGVELRRYEWVFHWVFVEWLCIWSYADALSKFDADLFQKLNFYLYYRVEGGWVIKMYKGLKELLQVPVKKSLLVSY